MKDMSEISTVKSARAKRTLPSLPKSSKPSNGVFLSPTSKSKDIYTSSVPTCSPKTARKNCTNSPLATTGRERAKPSRLPIKRTQSLSEISVQKSSTNNNKLRKQATINSSELSGKNYNNNNTKDIKLSTTPGELNKAKTTKNTTVKKQTNSLSIQPKTEPRMKKIQELSDAINHSNSESSILTKSESIDSVSGLELEEERSCVTVAVRVRPFNQR
jgi:hypothetical protein